MIELTQLTKTYNGFTAVDRLTLRVGRGEIFGFIGPNGAGKTTTIKMIVGVLAPTAGSVVVAGIDLQAEPEAKRKIGFIPTALSTRSHRPRILRFTADIYGVPVSDFLPKATAAWKVRLGGLANELIESYPTA
jgi:ABC-2 type transport system ATP-binding protein